MTRSLHWMGSAKADLSAFSQAVKALFGHALYEVQSGETPDCARPLPQFGGGVYELREEYDTNAYRCVYVVKLRKGVYVLHAFVKKSRSGRAIPRQDIGLIEERL